MGRTAARLGHEWAVLTDHSPRLTVARGLSPERLREQLAVVAELNERWAPFRLLTGIECDILDDGSLDQEPGAAGPARCRGGVRALQAADERRAMTRRMVAAVRDPHSDVLGHCTGRLVTGRGRPESEFDADEVFAACAETGHGGRDQQPPGAARPTAPTAPPGGRGGCAVLRGHRRARARAARLADRTGARGPRSAGCLRSGWSRPGPRRSCWRGQDVAKPRDAHTVTGKRRADLGTLTGSFPLNNCGCGWNSVPGPHLPPTGKIVRLKPCGAFRREATAIRGHPQTAPP
jgi:hypothetical protein